jgi:hypothetical protein
MIIKRSQASDFAAYLGQFDLHNHSFSHCVLTESDEQDVHHPKETDWKPQSPSLDEKIDFIVRRLKSTMQAGVNRGIRVLAFTEHPQYTFYSIPYPRYRRIFNTLRSQVGGFIEKVLWGLEVDLEITKNKMPFVNEEIIGSKDVGSKGVLLYDADLIVGSLHLYRDWRAEYLPKHQREQIVFYDQALDYIKNCTDYFELTMNALGALGVFRKRLDTLNGRSKTFVYGHPWGAAWMMNKKKFEQDKHSDTWLRLRKEHPQQPAFLDYHWGPEAPIQFFTKDQLMQVAEAHIENGIYPEVNCRYVGRGASEFSSPTAQPTLIDAYAERCAARGLPAYISVCSDAHSPAGLLKTDWRELAQKLPKNVLAWAENLS